MPFDFACPDWAERLAQGRTPIADLPLDRVAADRAVRIFDKLRLPDVPGQPAMREAAGEWFRDIIRAAFGSIDPATGVRQVGEIFALVPKKNAKTTNGAALTIDFLLLNERRHADLLLIGPTQKISDLAYEQAKGMIEADPDGYLQKRFHVQDHAKTIKDRTTQSRLMIRTFGADVLTGAKPIFVLLDEVHILGTIKGAAEVIRQLRGGFLPFPESLFVMITTQSDGPPAGVFKSELAYARGVRDGRITEGVNLLPVLYEFPEAMQRDQDQPWLDPRHWPMVTPNLGRSITIEGLTQLCNRAHEDGAGAVRGWATQHLNVEVGLALHSDRWAGVDHWESCADERVTLEAILAECEVATIGFDGGGLDDLAGLAVCGRHAGTRQWWFWYRAWAQTDVLERRKDIAERLEDFDRDGDLVICAADDPGRDFREVAEIVGRVQEAGLLPAEAAVGLDVYGVSDLVDLLLDPVEGPGLDPAQVVGVPQGFKLAAAIWGTERRLKARTMRHGGRPFMAWCAGNARSEKRGNNVYVTKQAAGSAKIDPLIAGFNAYQLMARNPVAAVRGSSLLDMEAVVA